MDKDRVLEEIREAIELNKTVRQKNNDALCHAEYLLKKEDEYNRGLNDAWEFVQKLIYLPAGDRSKIFGNRVRDVFENMTIQEALAKLEAYEKSKDEIKAGDIVFNDNTMEEGVVTFIGNGDVFMLYNDGSCGMAKGNLTKTGRHIDISALLAEIEKE